MGAKQFFGKIGKGIKKGLGKAYSGAKKIGKGALETGRQVSGVLDFGITAVKQVAKEIDDVPLLGEVARGLLDTPIGQQVSAVFKSAGDVNQALKEAVEIGDSIEKLGKRVEELDKNDLKNPETRKEILHASAGIARNISNSKVGKEARRIPAVKSSVKKYNKIQKDLEKKLSKEDVRKLKKLAGRINRKL